MDLLENIKTRRSIRKYQNKKVDDKLIDKIIEAGLYAASGRGKQSSIIISVSNEELVNRLSKVNAKIGGWDEGFDPFYGSKSILIVLADKQVSNVTTYDGSLVMGNMMLEAHELGLGSCWIHRAKETFEMEEWKNWLKSIGANGDYEGIAFLALGYPCGDIPSAALRKENRVFYVK